MREQLLTAGTILLSTIAATAIAGDIWTSDDHGHGHGSGSGYSSHYGYRLHASTVAEGYFRGQAAVIDATGRYNLNTSQAAIHFEEARRLAFENYEQSVDTYFRVRDKNRLYRSAERGRKVTQQDAVRYSKALTPKRVTTQQVDPIFGTITWPAIFGQEQFTQARQAVDEHFCDRSYTGAALDMQKRRVVSQATTAMQYQLRSFLDEVTSAEYLQAKNFLRTLNYEARFAPQLETVAQR